jgi:tetratricopeptide (TPR) repeat protein
MRFCPHCGAPLLAGAKFCVQCGQRLSARGRPAGKADDPKPGADLGFLAVFSGLVVAGAMIAWVLVVREQRFDVAASAGNLAAPTASQGAATSGVGLPADHPKIQLPPEALKFIETLKHQAEQKPNDVALWNEFGDVAFRAALLDPAFYEAAARAYTHVLKLDPDNLGALRGIGNVNYDRRHYDEATAAYEHYLRQKPDDPAVRTDLGTLYLYTGNADQAVVQYNRALQVKPDFFEAYFNLGVAYNQLGQRTKAIEALNRALTLAPDDRARSQVRQLIAEAGVAPPSFAAPGPGAANLAQGPATQEAPTTDTASQSSVGANRGASAASSATAPSVTSSAKPAPLELTVVKVPNPSLNPTAESSEAGAVPHHAGAGGLGGMATSPSTGSSVIPEHAAGAPSTAGTKAADVSMRGASAGNNNNDVAGSISSPGSSDTLSGGTNYAMAAGAPGLSAPSSAADQQPGASATPPASSTASFAGAIEVMLRGLPVAGPRVKAVQWPSQLEAKVLLENFPMDQMPPFVKEKFISDIKRGIGQAKRSYRVEQPFTLDLADAESGRVMETVTQ